MPDTAHANEGLAEALLEEAKAGVLLVPRVFAELREGSLSEEDARKILDELEIARDRPALWFRARRFL